MNIFVTDPNPRIAAKNLDDKRVIKMVLETAQILSTAVTINGGRGIYKPTHKFHPCVQWAAKNHRNWMWLFNHFICLHNEFIELTGKKHKSFITLIQEGLVVEASRVIPKSDSTTPFVNCAANKSLGISYTDQRDVYIAYQLYLNDRWETDKRKPTWSRGNGRTI